MTLASSFVTTPDLDDQAQLYTDLNDPEIAGIIAHINEEHIDELLGFLRAFSPLSAAELEHTEVQLTAIYAEGICLQAKSLATRPIDSKDSHRQPQSFFIGFAAPLTQVDELQEQYILLRQRADKKLGKKTIKLTRQVFVVERSYKVSENMLRLELSMDSQGHRHDSSSPDTVPTNEAGYAYLFDLAHNAMTASSSQPSKNTAPPARAQVYYTLRKAWRSADGVQAWVDVFLHGDTSGGNWAMALQVGDTVVTKREFPEKVAHLHTGQTLLIVDETSMPTAARLLELWDNPTPPLIICVTQDAADQKYFDDITLSIDAKDSSKNSARHHIDRHFTVLPMIMDPASVGQNVAPQIDRQLADYLAKQPLQIDKVWGALEAKTAKALRPLLQKRLGLERSDVVVKVYWRHD
ncbi:SIP domain-containing protein [Psychrobacter celer]|uniref:SIP domain-containing protein n=1 Tax=Psychrobacter celer TaxID=306572 RepID=UPI002FE452A0